MSNAPNNKFEHCLTPADFTLLLNAIPVLTKRGSFRLSEYNQIAPLHARMMSVAHRNRALFQFSDVDDADDAEGDGVVSLINVRHGEAAHETTHNGNENGSQSNTDESSGSGTGSETESDNDSSWQDMPIAVGRRQVAQAAPRVADNANERTRPRIVNTRHEHPREHGELPPPGRDRKSNGRHARRHHGVSA
jgi:hypothetical protein